MEAVKGGYRKAQKPVTPGITWLITGFHPLTIQPVVIEYPGVNVASTIGAPLSLTIVGSAFYDDTAITAARRALDTLRKVYGITVYLDVENIDASIGAPAHGSIMGWYPETTYIIVGGSIIEVAPDINEDELVDKIIDAVLGSLGKPSLAYNHEWIYPRNDRTPGMSDAVLAS